MLIDPGSARILVAVELILALGILPFLLLMPAPYGRFSKASWGPRLPSAAAWALMEAPSLLIPAAFWIATRGWNSPFASACVFAWVAHYAHRVILYPFLSRGGKPMPLAVCLMAFSFNILNAYVNSWYLLAPGSTALAERSLLAPAPVIGAILFIAGFTVNIHSDRVLRRLRRAKGGYAVPNEGMHRIVANPNYLGEIIEWTGWAILAATPAAWAFAAFTAANLVPRALKNRRWYLEKFGDEYPRERKAVIPFVL